MYDMSGNFNNQPMYNQPMPGYNYMGMQQPVAKVMNNLSAEEIKSLQQTQEEFRLNLTEREALQAGCNHRSLDGMTDSLEYDPVSHQARCTICGYVFRPIEPDTNIEDIEDDCDRIVDILQTIKIMFTDLPAKAAREYFMIIPLIKKIPDLFKMAAKNFSNHEFNGWNYQNKNMGGMAMLNNLNSILGSGFNTGFQQAPQPNMYGGQPMGYPGAAYQQPMQQPMGNPFGYPQGPQGFQQQPMMNGYQPQNPGFAYNPAQSQATPVTPTATPAEDAKNVTTTQKVEV